jgi:hypothetical protein
MEMIGIDELDEFLSRPKATTKLFDDPALAKKLKETREFFRKKGVLGTIKIR